MGVAAAREPSLVLPGRGVRVYLADNLPSDARAAMVRVLDTYGFVLPLWLHALAVEWDDTDTDNQASVITEIRYRDARLAVCPGWFSHPEAERDATLVHELVHILLEPLSRRTQALAKLVGRQAPAVKGLMSDDADDVVEQVVTDVAHALLGRPRGG